MRVVVTGATGNIGTALLAALARDPGIEEVVGLARRLPDVALPKVTWRRAHVVASDLLPVFRGADAVVHLAWLVQPAHRPEVLRRTNVTGTARVLEAVQVAGVPTIVHASSVGAYAAGPRDRRVDERWPATGIPGSGYSRDKAACELLLDRFESEHPGVRVVRMRKALAFQRAQGSEVVRLFLGPFVPRALLRPGRLPLVPIPRGLALQLVHADDAAEAYRLALHGDVRGPLNVAAEPVLDADAVARVIGGRRVSVPKRLARGAVAAGFGLRLHRADPGWLDMGFGVPLMDTARIRRELRWAPRVASSDALRELLEGIADGAGRSTPPLAPSRAAPGPIAARR